MSISGTDFHNLRKLLGHNLWDMHYQKYQLGPRLKKQAKRTEGISRNNKRGVHFVLDVERKFYFTYKASKVVASMVFEHDGFQVMNGSTITHHQHRTNHK